MTSVSLTNGGKRMMTINATHSSAKHTTVTHKQRTLNRRSGKVGVKRLTCTVPESLTLPVGASKAGLPLWWKDLPDVRRLQPKGLKVKVTKS